MGLIVEWFRRWSFRLMCRRKPDQIIGVDYMRRWHVVPRNPLLNIYLHAYRGSDDDRALHDHPWPSLSLCLEGLLREHRADGSTRWIGCGQWIYRPASFAHRLEVTPGIYPITLFITGPKVRAWGFHCPRGWVPWREFVDPDDHGRIGRGCGET